jgi:general stress protein CsbA
MSDSSFNNIIAQTISTFGGLFLLLEALRMLASVVSEDGYRMSFFLIGFGVILLVIGMLLQMVQKMED